MQGSVCGAPSGVTTMKPTTSKPVGPTTVKPTGPTTAKPTASCDVSNMMYITNR